MNSNIEEILLNIEQHQYLSENIPLKIEGLDKNRLGVKVCSNSPYKDYLLYENAGEVAIGLGKKITFTVGKEHINLMINTKQVDQPIKDLSQDIHQILKAVSIKDWRAYGIANFGLAYKNHGIREQREPDKLLELFIPEIDVRIKNKQITVRSFSQNDIDHVKKIINCFKSEPSIFEKNDMVKHGLFFGETLQNQYADQYKGMVSKAVEDIRTDQYQKIILSRKIYLDDRLNMMESYLVGREKNTPARSYCLQLDDLEVIGFSPETVVEVDTHRKVFTFPLAGTRAMGETEAQQVALKGELLTDPKEIAEHAVSVRLAYEELEQVCKEDTVSVIRFMDILERGTVQHLASRLQGSINDDVNEWHAFNALFPAVTASGIPKRESLQAIYEIEEEPRELYSGSVIVYDEDGTLDAALVLRSVYQNRQATWLRAGAGIVELSSPERELEETREKLSSVFHQLIKANA